MLKKMTCLLTEAIYPDFREILVEDIQKSDFVLEYDETTNNNWVKELQKEFDAGQKSRNKWLLGIFGHIIWDMQPVKI